MTTKTKTLKKKQPKIAKRTQEKIQKKSQYRLCIYFQTEKELERYNSLVAEFMEKQQLNKKSEAMKKMLILSNVHRESDKKFKSDLNDILEDLANRVDLVELETRFLVNQRKHKETIPEEIRIAWEEQKAE